MVDGLNVLIKNNLFIPELYHHHQYRLAHLSPCNISHDVPK